MAKNADGYETVKGTMEIWHDEETDTIFVGPYEESDGQFEAFVRKSYPHGRIEFTTPRLKRNLRAEEKAKRKADIEARIAEIEQERGDSAALRRKYGRNAIRVATTLRAEQDKLQKQLAEM